MPYGLNTQCQNCGNAATICDECHALEMTKQLNIELKSERNRVLGVAGKVIHEKAMYYCWMVEVEKEIMADIKTRIAEKGGD